MFLADYSAGYKGNFIYGLSRLADKIKKNGGEVFWVLPKKADDAQWSAELENVFFLSDNKSENFRLICGIIRKYKINIIYSHFMTLKYDIPLKFARLLNPTVFYARHMHMIYRNKGNFIAERVKRFFSNGQIEIACSAYASQAMKNAGFKSVYEVENAIDFARLEDFSEPFFCDGKKHILMFGYSYINKGVDIAVRAAKKLGRDDFELDICAAAYLQEVKASIIDEFGAIPEFIKFLPPRNDIGAYYGSADVFLSSSPAESFCFAVREAAYCGCRIVASDIGAHRIDCGELLFECGSAEELTKKLNVALDSGRVSEKLRAGLRKRYDVDEMCEQLLKIFSKEITV